MEEPQSRPPNSGILDALFADGAIDLCRGPLFDSVPGPLPGAFDFDRVEGMMLGLAVGDSLGAASEGQTPWRRRAVHGEIRDYLSRPSAGGRRLGLPTDDTQLAFWTLEQMLEDRGLVPPHLAGRFCRQPIFGIGSSVREFIGNFKSGRPWHGSGPASAGNGALMRIAPLVIPHLRTGTAALWADTALAALITHNDSASLASCLAVVKMLRDLLAMSGPPEPLWWLETFVETARGLERRETYAPRGGAWPEYRGPLWRFVQEKVGLAWREGWSVLEACERWLSGAYLLETVPSVLYILMRHAHDFEEAVVRAVNDTRDNDTIAAVVGALAGALHGRRAIPPRWLSGLPGRTGAADDGRVYELLRQARALWWA